jgi:phospholipase C
MNTSGVATRVVIMVQENHTTDHYFRSMREFGANVATDGPISRTRPPTIRRTTGTPTTGG